MIGVLHIMNKVGSKIKLKVTFKKIKNLVCKSHEEKEVKFKGRNL